MTSPSVRVNVRLSRHLAGRLDQLAAGQGVGRSAMLRQLIMDAAPNGDELPTEEEILRLLWEKARSGNVGACKYLLEHEHRGLGRR
jgi:predicted transcriptional regulator